MALPLIGSAIGALMRRYGLKGLTEAGERAALGKARGQLGAEATSKAIKSKAKSNTRKDAAWNAVGDVGTVGLAGSAISMDSELEGFKSKEELEKFIKNEKPKLWRQYAESSFDDITKFLKSMKG